MLKVRNWYIKKERCPKIGQLVTLCYDKLVSTPQRYYVYTEKTARYLGNQDFSFQNEEQEWSPKINLAQYPMDSYFEKRTQFSDA